MKAKEFNFANRISYSDIEPYEIVRRLSDCTIEVRAMDATFDPSAKDEFNKSFIPGGFLGNFDNDLQKWIFSRNTENQVHRLRKHKDGAYYGSMGKFVLSDEPYKKYDYNF